MQSTVVTEEGLGSENAIIYSNETLHDCKLEPGQVQRACFQPGNPPPFYDLELPRTDVPTGKQYGTKRLGSWWARRVVVVWENRRASDKLFLNEDCGKRKWRAARTLIHL